MRMREIVGFVVGVVAIVAVCAASQDAPKKQDPAPKKKPAEPIVEAAKLETLPGTRISAGKTYDNQPAAAATADGRTWIAYVRYQNRRADEIVVVSRQGEEISAPQTLTAAPGQYIRPVLVAQGNDVWCFWTASEPDRVATVWHSRRAGDRWTPAARLLPSEPRAHQNPEAAAGRDGRLAVACQVHTGKAYEIHLQAWDGKEWSGARKISEEGTNNWDPGVAIDAKGIVHAVWSAFRDGDYDVVAWREGGRVRRLSARGEYDLHPWISAAPDGSVWAAWDVVHVPRHGNSGRTTITGANRPYMEDEGGYKTGAYSEVEVQVLNGDEIRVPGEPRKQIVAPKGYKIAHTALPKLAFGPRGEPWIFHRVLRRALETPGTGFYWDLIGRPFRNGSWGDAVRFSEADGYLEEPAVASTSDGIRVVYGGEHRNAHLKTNLPPHDESVAHDHHRDFDSRRGWNGEVFAALAAAGAAGPDVAALPAAKAPVDRPAPARDRVDPYSATVNGKTYRLLWGDTHRHSNVSRCSQGNEPSPDDLYRYGTDICRYDWFALSDHAEDPRQTGADVLDYYWWKQQKLADLYHVPNAMSVLYNLEWSLGYPHGHHNTVFPSRPTYRLDRYIASSKSLEAGWKVLEREKVRAITIPHTGADPGMGTAWEVQDDRYQRLCEIFQACRGSYEHSGCPREFSNTRNKKGFYWNALEKGYHVGVIASTDHGYGVAYACVYAPENTRESIWQAMWDRRTYGSTTYGLVLELRSGNRWMGEEWTQKDAPPLEIYVRGAAPIRSVEIIGRSRVLHAEGSIEKPLHAKEHRIRWTDPEWETQTTEQWYYVRVIQDDDEMAWSSPVWVKKP